jgi:hypothetical protein
MWSFRVELQKADLRSVSEGVSLDDRWMVPRYLEFSLPSRRCSSADRVASRLQSALDLLVEAPWTAFPEPVPSLQQHRANHRQPDVREGACR